MKPKFDISNLANMKWVGFAAAGVAAVVAFIGSLQDQQQEKTIQELGERVAKLENDRETH
jgi:hypothetical protein